MNGTNIVHRGGYLIETAIHVGLTQDIGIRLHHTIGIVLNLLHRRVRISTLLGQGVLVRVLGGIGVHQRTKVSCPITGVRIPLVVRIEARVGQDLQDLVGVGSSEVA